MIANIRFEEEKRIKGAIRYKEIKNDLREEPLVGTIYIRKDSKLDAKEILVTIKEIEP